MQTGHLDFFDNYAAWQLPWWRQPEVLLGVFFVVLVVVMIVYAIVMGIKKRLVVRCPYKIVLAALENLDRDRLLTRHDRAVELSRLVREFVGRTAHVDCLSFTDSELVRFLGQCQYADLLRKSIVDLVDWCGWQKFSLLADSDFGDGDLCVARLVDQLRLCIVDIDQKK